MNDATQPSYEFLSGIPDKTPKRFRITKPGLADRRAVLLEIVRAAQPATVREIFYLASVRHVLGERGLSAKYPPAARAAWAEHAHAVRIEDEMARRGYPFWMKPRHDNVGQPCPMCGGADRFSLSVKKQVFNCRRCDKKGDVISLVQALDNVGYLDAIACLAGGSPQSSDCSIRKQREAATKHSNEELPNGTRTLAMALWRASVNPRGTLAVQYLKSRALDLPSVAANETIRFHPACSFGSERFPAMVCLVRGIISNEPQAVHRTALATDGTAIRRNGKTLRMSLGPIACGAIKLDPDEDIAQGLCVGEGVETCLAGRQMGLRPVWSLLNTAGIAAFPVLRGLECLHIFRENDVNLAGPKASEECAGRWLDAGREVIFVDSEYGNDLADEI